MSTDLGKKAPPVYAEFAENSPPGRSDDDSFKSSTEKSSGFFISLQGSFSLWPGPALFNLLLVALILDSGKGRLKDLSRIVPERIRYWAMMRMIRSGWWDPQALMKDVAERVMAGLPAPADGVLYVIGDTTLKGKRGLKHPLGFKTRMNEYAAYVFGFAAVLLIVHWGRFRIPIAVALIDPQRAGHQNILFRQMLRTFVPPAWAKKVVVLADAGFAAKATLKVIRRKRYDYVFALPRTWKLADGTHLRDLARHLPKHLYHRVASYKPVSAIM